MAEPAALDALRTIRMSDPSDWRAVTAACASDDEARLRRVMDGIGK